MKESNLDGGFRWGREKSRGRQQRRHRFFRNARTNNFAYLLRLVRSGLTPQLWLEPRRRTPPASRTVLDGSASHPLVLDRRSRGGTRAPRYSSGGVPLHARIIRAMIAPPTSGATDGRRRWCQGRDTRARQPPCPRRGTPQRRLIFASCTGEGCVSCSLPALASGCTSRSLDSKNKKIGNPTRAHGCQHDNRGPWTGRGRRGGMKGGAMTLLCLLLFTRVCSTSRAVGHETGCGSSRSPPYRERKRAFRVAVGVNQPAPTLVPPRQPPSPVPLTPSAAAV